MVAYACHSSPSKLKKEDLKFYVCLGYRPCLKKSKLGLKRRLSDEQLLEELSPTPNNPMAACNHI